MKVVACRQSGRAMSQPAGRKARHPDQVDRKELSGRFDDATVSDRRRLTASGIGIAWDGGVFRLPMRLDDLVSRDDSTPASGGARRRPRALPRQAPGSDAPRDIAVIRASSGCLVLLAPQAATVARPLVPHVAGSDGPRLLSRARRQARLQDTNPDFPAFAAPFSIANPPRRREGRDGASASVLADGSHPRSSPCPSIRLSRPSRHTACAGRVPSRFPPRFQGFIP
jgi:hypothetical protein